MDLSYKKLGELLVANGLLTEQQLRDALAMQRQSPARLGEIATAMGWASEKQISECLAEQLGYRLVDAAGARPVSFGGDQAVTGPILKALAGADAKSSGGRTCAQVHFDPPRDP